MSGTLVIEKFIEQLQILARQRFPVEKVSEFLNNVQLPLVVFQKYSFFLSERYTRNLIYKSPAFEILLLCWRAGQESPIHGHEGEKCWMRVLQGDLRFINYKEANQNPVMLEQVSSRIGHTGFVDGPAVIHKVENCGDHAMSLHLYARPFMQCDIYQENLCNKTKKSLAYDSVYGKPTF